MEPRKQLKHFSVGDTVTLKGALIEKTAPLFIGRIDDNGYYFLWKSEKAFESGKFWDHAAAGSHGVV